MNKILFKDFIKYLGNNFILGAASGIGVYSGFTLVEEIRSKIKEKKYKRENKKIIIEYLKEEKKKLYEKIINSNKEDDWKFLDDVANWAYISNLITNLLKED